MTNLSSELLQGVGACEAGLESLLQASVDINERKALPVKLVDLASIYWSAWHASADTDVGAAFETTIAAVSRISGGSSVNVAVCVDSPPYKRNAIAKTYKAQREASPPMAVEQYRRTQERLRKDGYLVWSCKGFEADDLIATAAAQLRAKHEVRVYSADKDLLQLVGFNVVVVRRERTEDGSRLVDFDAEAVKAKMGVYPNMLRDLLAMAGDKSDNVPGIPGVGPAKAAALLLKYGTLAEVLRCADDIPGKLGEAICQNVEQALLSQQLVTLYVDAPIDAQEVFATRKTEPLTEETYETMHEEQDEPKSDTQSERPSEPPPAPHIEGEPVAHLPRKATAGQAIELAQPPAWHLQLEPRDSGGAWNLAKMLANSRLYSAYGSPEAIMAIVLRGRALGLDATTALASFHVIEGKPSMSAALMIGLVHRSGKALFFDCIDSTSEKAVWVTKRVGSQHESRNTFTMDDAKRAGLGTKGNWAKYPAEMLRWRAASALARMVYPDIVAGLYTPDELTDGEE